MTPYLTQTDICNRALQHVGTPQLDTVLGLEDGSRQATECLAVYDKLRQAELRRNTWKFAIRQTVLRPVDSSFRQLVPAAYAGGTTYEIGSVVSHSNAYWISNTNSHSGNTPGSTDQWEPYFGPSAIPEYDSDVSYYAGEVVYKASPTGTYTVWMSLENDNDDNPTSASEWDSTVTYAKGALAYIDLTLVDGSSELVDDDISLHDLQTYVSLSDFNTGNNPLTSPLLWSSTTTSRGGGSTKWQKLSCTLKQLFLAYPLGVGPAHSTTAKRLFKLPFGYLKWAPQAPKAGAIGFLGASSAQQYKDWDFERDYITSLDDLIILRFVADVSDVKTFDVMFSEGLACRIGYEVCEPITNSREKGQKCASEYTKFMSEARLTNALEIGAIEPPEDEFITVRM